MPPRTARAPLLFLPLLLPLASCLGPEAVATAGFSAAQAGVFEYKKGTMRTAWDAPMETMFEASRQALADLEFQIMREVSTGEEWNLRAMELDYTAIDIYLEQATPAVTIVSIRVGTWGDQPVSKLIADRIDKRIKAWEKGREGEEIERRRERETPGVANDPAVATPGAR